MGLLGKSSRSLALWLTEVKLVKPDVILHECTVKFNSELLWQHLADYDIVHMKLSPVDFGWPAQRPRLVCRETVREGEVAVAVCRLFTVMLRKETVSINGGVDRFLQMLQSLMMRPTADVGIFYCAPQESIDAHRAAGALKRSKPRKSAFKDLLGGAKQTWLECYRNLKKVRQIWAKGSRYAVCNLAQNPRIMPVVSDKMPTLLRTASNMWLMDLSPQEQGQQMPTSSKDAPTVGLEERHLLSDEALVLMGIPVFPDLAASGNFFRFPHSEMIPKFSDTCKYELAGNES
ncbi:unnamed protein product, partial [Symbiodinium sp. CCMP2456]